MNWPAALVALEAAGCTITPEGRAMMEPKPLDLTAIFDRGVCTICGQPRTPEGACAHASRHLAVAEARVEHSVELGVVQSRVVPNVSAPVSPELPANFFRTRDPKLRRLANAALKRARKNASPPTPNKENGK